MTNSNNPLRCQRCGNALPPKATRWCSDACRSAGYAATHRAARAATKRKYRAKVRAARLGLPKPLTPEQALIAELAEELSLTRLAITPEE